MSLFSDISSVYFIGIGGAGMSGLARMAHRHGKQVSGSDLDANATVENLRTEGIEVFTPQQASNVPLTADLYVYSDAVTVDNPERAVLVENNLESKAMSYFEALGEFIKLYKNRIAVSGTHGKTTTTAMLGLVLEEAEKDPSAIVGSVVDAWHSNVRVGKKQECVVVEACEYKEHMLQLDPTAIILNNIEADHLDFYRDIDHIVTSFQTYVQRLPETGLLVVNTDDPLCVSLNYTAERVTFGINNSADIMATNIQTNGETQTFDVQGHTYTLHTPGRYNIYNALGVIALSLTIGVAPEAIARGLEKFTGTWRRYEHVGTYNGADVIVDYAHHPTAIRGLLAAAKQSHPDKRVVIAYQPHQHNRTHRLFDEFVQAFDDAGLVIVQEIFDVAGREEAQDQIITSRDLVEEIAKRDNDAHYTADAAATLAFLQGNITENDIVLIVGAGDIYKVAEQLCK